MSFDVRLSDRTFPLISDASIFSKAKLDEGTRLLLETIPSPPDGRLVDLGCGSGAIACALALRNPRASVTAIDVNERARELARENVRALGLATIDVPENLDPRPYEALYSNPPIRIGKDALHSLLAAWLSPLHVGTCAYLVVQKHLGADSLAAWMESTGFSVERLASKKGYRIFAVKRPKGAA